MFADPHTSTLLLLLLSPLLPLLLLLLLLPAGLLRLVGNEDELAAVLAHEVSIRCLAIIQRNNKDYTYPWAMRMEILAAVLADEVGIQQEC
jgi:predicted Zn-dependent protease